jgi:hypothetical protein
MMRTLVAAVCVCCACGEPEQLLHVVGALDSAVISQDERVKLVIERDEGATLDGCGTFATDLTLDAGVNVFFQFDVLKAETLGPNGTPRCFRASWGDDDTGRSQLTWVPMDHDVTLPRFTVWPLQGYLGHTLFEEFTSDHVTFSQVPSSLVGNGVDEVDAVTQPRHLIEVLDENGTVMWRAIEGDPLSELTMSDPASMSWVVSSLVSEDHRVSLRAAGFMLGRTFALDPLGRSVELHFEYRLVTNTLPINVPRQTPPSRGAKCDGFVTCPFTDGDFTEVATNITQLSLDLGKDVIISTVAVHGLWSDSSYTNVLIQTAEDAAPNDFTGGPISVDPQAVLVLRDGLLAPSRIDRIEQINPRKMRYLRVSLLDADNNPVPLTRLAEVSLFE